MASSDATAPEPVRSLLRDFTDDVPPNVVNSFVGAGRSGREPSP